MHTVGIEIWAHGILNNYHGTTPPHAGTVLHSSTQGGYRVNLFVSGLDTEFIYGTGFVCIGRQRGCHLSA